MLGSNFKNDNVHKEMGNKSRKIETLRKNQRKC